MQPAVRFRSNATDGGRMRLHGVRRAHASSDEHRGHLEPPAAFFVGLTHARTGAVGAGAPSRGRGAGPGGRPGGPAGRGPDSVHGRGPTLSLFSLFSLFLFTHRDKDRHRQTHSHTHARTHTAIYTFHSSFSQSAARLPSLALSKPCSLVTVTVTPLQSPSLICSHRDLVAVIVTPSLSL